MHFGPALIFIAKFGLAFPVTFHLWNGFRWEQFTNHSLSISRSVGHNESQNRLQPFSICLFLGTWLGIWATGSKFPTSTSPAGSWLGWRS